MFLETDLIPGGGANNYDYAMEDLVNKFELCQGFGELLGCWPRGGCCDLVRGKNFEGGAVAEGGMKPGPWGLPRSLVGVEAMVNHVGLKSQAGPNG